MKESSIVRARGRPRKTIDHTIKRDFEVHSVSLNLIHDMASCIV